MYEAIRDRFDKVTGSEFLGDDVPLGDSNDAGVRNEDSTRLTFADESFDCLVSLDVLEHVPDYEKALQEFARCLKPGGKLVLTVPFNLESYPHIERARIVDGEIEHILPPEYHGDPLNQGGVLCFRHFGWSLLDNLRQNGFSKAALYFYWSKEFGYFGGWPFIIFAVR